MRIRIKEASLENTKGNRLSMGNITTIFFIPNSNLLKYTLPFWYHSLAARISEVTPETSENLSSLTQSFPNPSKTCRNLKKMPFIWVYLARKYQLGTLFLRFVLETGPPLGAHPSQAKIYPFAGQREYLHFSVILRPWVLVRSREWNWLPPALQSSALPTELILLQ